MAITILQAPRTRTPVYNDVVLTVDSTNVAQPKFSYIFEIYDGTNTTKLATLRIPPEINYQYGVVHLQGILQAFVKSDFFGNDATTGVKPVPNTTYDYYVRIGEEYEVAGVITQFLNLDTVNDTVFAGSLQYEKFVTFDITDYDLNGSKKLFFTNRPLTFYVGLTDEGYTGAYKNAGYNFEVRTYDSSGSLVQTATFDGTTDLFVNVPTAPLSINNTTLLTGTQPLITSSIARYEINCIGTGVPRSVTLDIRLKEYCQSYNLHFLNDFGWFDYFRFITAKESFDFEKDNYKQDPLRLQSDGSYVWSTQDREVVQYQTTQKQKLKLFSDWITEEEAIWLREMVSSPEVYIDWNGNRYSIVITNTNYQVKQEGLDEIFNIELDVEFSVNTIRQKW